MAVRPASKRVGAGARAIALLFPVMVALTLLTACGGGSSSAQGNDPCAAIAPKGTVPQSASGHVIYQRVAVGPLPSQTLWHTGETMTFQWCVAPTTPAHDVGDAQESLAITLDGPYPSNAAAQAAAGQATDSPVATAQPITTDVWSATALSSALRLPATLPSGYYVVTATVNLGNTTGQGSNGAIAPTSQQTQIIQVAG